MKHSKRGKYKDMQNVSDGLMGSHSQEKRVLSLDDALLLFVKSHSAIGHSKATQRDYNATIGVFLRYMRDTHQYASIDQISEGDIVEWLAYLRNAPTKYGRPYSSRSIQTYSRNVTVFFNWLVRHGHVAVNPAARIEKPKVEKALIRVFAEDELKRLDDACNRAPKGRALTEDERKALAARDRAFLWLLLSTGIRVSEACGLQFRDLDWKEGMLYVHGKGAKERRVPFGRVARQHLDTYIRYWRGEPSEKIQPDDFVFLSAYGEPLSTQAALSLFTRLKRVAEINDKRVSPHTCRHWFAVNAIKNGMPTIVLKGILGHESWDMIEVYVHLAEQDVKESYDRFSPADALEMHRYPKGKREQLRGWRNARRQEKKS